MVNLGKLSAFLEIMREFIETKVAVWIAEFFETNPINVSWIIYIVISLYLGNKIFKIWFSEIKGREPTFIAIVAGILFILKFI